MPKEKRSLQAVLNRFVHDYEDFTTDGKTLFCKYCDDKVSAAKKFQVQQHLQTGKHIRNKINITNTTPSFPSDQVESNANVENLSFKNLSAENNGIPLLHDPLAVEEEYRETNNPQETSNLNLVWEARNAFQFAKSLLNKQEESRDVFAKFVASELKQIQDSAIYDATKWKIQVALKEGLQTQNEKSKLTTSLSGSAVESSPSASFVCPTSTVPEKKTTPP